ncbi:Amylo-alpha-1,6-glucosidase [Caulifigura coniformis]|uniref:Amylo-alpha-1,6-glucosidase n=1 Tax=Caulifigura coniformis TaxID=2527983 RepID=A0A517SAH7_9PLAN|nr:amylo-alpha-1,6-glucosidase [Caulifigura coniformis]QDT53122.1 Amylo-alpha-1,6-glucosidase [Caulifigura coniformis]
MLIRTMPWSTDASATHDPLVTREWLVTNGLGGYASGTVAGVATRRYHGLLIAAMPAPLGRMMMLNHLSEQVRLRDGSIVLLGGEERVPELAVHGASYLKEFRLENGLPVWRYQINGTLLEKRLFMPRNQNTVHLNYRVLEGHDILRLKLMPSVHFRSHDAPVNSPLPKTFELRVVDDRFELLAGKELPVLRLTTYGTRTAFTIERRYFHEMLFRIEESRGYESVGDLWSPGYFRFDLAPGMDATVIASTEEWKTILAMEPDEAFLAENVRRERLLSNAPKCARGDVGGELVLAADQFVIRPIGRAEDVARAKATGDEGRTVIAGYHWFTDWGRDTMISLEGLTLSTGRQSEGGYILRTFAQHIRDGLIPNLFPEGQDEGLYHTADATLWFFHALDRYVRVTGDRGTLREILPRLIDIYDHHVGGTRYRIGVDAKDGLLRQGQDGYQLTWMDAKMGDWVVTPRRGKAVEINALWYNAVRLLERWVGEENGTAAAKRYQQLAAQIRESFNLRFWNDDEHGLFDVVDGERGNDASVRPNQLFAISLPNPVLKEDRWKAVVDVAEKKLLTPVGLRSLSPDDKEYKPTYRGDLRTRDAAYHQGTVWGWLIGPFVDSWLKVYPERRAEARSLLNGLMEHLGEACIGSVSEVFDAESPFHPRGCCAQAWSVAEVLRCWVLTDDRCTSEEGPGGT